ncbi:MAG TPA: hypothetical protein VIU93_11620 [Gallionellaceae bacterium]
MKKMQFQSNVVLMRLLQTVLLSVLLMACSREEGHTVQAGNSTQRSDTGLASAVVAMSSETEPSSKLRSESGVSEVSKKANRSEYIEEKMNSEVSDPNAPLEAAVLYGGVVLPVLSIPSRQGQFLAQSDFESQHRSRRGISSCAVGDWCKTSIALVAKHHHMGSIPVSWFDSKGHVYEVEGGVYVVSDTGNFVGFSLRPASSGSEEKITEDRVLLSRKDGFAAVKTLPPSEWKDWPEFRQEINSWKSKQLSKCNSKNACKEAVNWLTSEKHIQGEAVEFQISDGRKLQFLRATSSTQSGGVLVPKPIYIQDVTPPDSLHTNLWRLVNTDNSVRVLRISNESWLADLGNTILNDPYCENQCGPSFTGRPEVISAKGRTYIFGSYSGGTVSGYLFFEVLPTELRFLERYRGGS